MDYSDSVKNYSDSVMDYSDSVMDCSDTVMDYPGRFMDYSDSKSPPDEFEKEFLKTKIQTKIDYLQKSYKTASYILNMYKNDYIYAHECYISIKDDETINLPNKVNSKLDRELERSYYMSIYKETQELIKELNRQLEELYS